MQPTVRAEGTSKKERVAKRRQTLAQDVRPGEAPNIQMSPFRDGTIEDRVPHSFAHFALGRGSVEEKHAPHP